MKKITVVFLLTLGVLISTSCKETENNIEIELVTAEEMKSILELEDVQLIDVRTPEEYDEIHIVNAQNIDFMSPTFDNDISKLDKSKPVILYCRSGGRSAKCAEKMLEAGFEKIYDLEGGISKWQHSDKLNIKRKS
ncbi:rhodanese-like domain-containing protein [Winogradskyella sp. DF17]|jgi:rhodanese-related sulfurtransferase|uniref:Rhodanese-like domain-containing protein n=1 Tax=Winogradskyella pelagia TaxID=2819984 RepID=A0ABS3T4M4_9FLAO|nr:rhodanese-like domain-containing protein [Winogradskyella sp. DF17]MBO3117695.1 rhodanese-like domain-containing protein [Winogradskyella sp. DF17]